MDIAFFDKEIKQAMLAKDSVRLRGLRAIKAALLLAKTEKGHEGEPNDAEVAKLLQKLVKQRRESADIYKEQGRADLAAIEEEEIGVINEYLPKQMTEEEVMQSVKTIIAELGAGGMKDMGKVMGAANARLAGKADGKLIAQIVKQQLG